MKLSDDELAELQNPDNWDTENVEYHQGNKDRRTIVSVGFKRADFKALTEYAARHKRKVSALIRERALEPSNRAMAWECPKCGKVNAPWKATCDCVGTQYVPYPVYPPYNPFPYLPTPPLQKRCPACGAYYVGNHFCWTWVPGSIYVGDPPYGTYTVSSTSGTGTTLTLDGPQREEPTT